MSLKFCSLSSGSDGNCLYVESGFTKILIDAGLSGKRIQEALLSIGVSPLDISAILVSHEHADHVSGAGILSRRFDTPIYANAGTWSGMLGRIGNVNERNVKQFSSDAQFCIGEIAISPFRVSHDANEPVGFVIESSRSKISIMTDTGVVNEEMISAVQGSDLYLIEANHDERMLRNGPYSPALKARILSDFGHMSNSYCSSVLDRLLSKGGEKVLLGHLSEVNNLPDVAYRTVFEALLNTGRKESDFELSVAMRHKRTDIIEI